MSHKHILIPITNLLDAEAKQDTRCTASESLRDWLFSITILPGDKLTFTIQPDFAPKNKQGGS